MADTQLSVFLDLAIQREVEAYDFYMDLFNRVDDETAKDALQWIARQETAHKEFLLKYKEGKIGPGAYKITDVVNQKIAEHLAEPELKEAMEPKDVYLLAAHRELKSYNFYTEFALMHTEGELKEMIMKIANEELKHKEKVEYLYSNTAFTQTAGG